MTNELKQFLLKRQKRADAIFDKLIGMDIGKAHAKLKKQWWDLKSQKVGSQGGRYVFLCNGSVAFGSERTVITDGKSRIVEVK